MHFSGAVARLRGPIRNRTKPMLSHLPSGSFSRTVLQQQAINQQALSQFMLGVNGCTTRSHVRAGSVQNAQHGPCTVLHHGLRLHGGSVRTVASSSAYDNPALYSNEDTFSEASYWDKFYKHEKQPFEWYRGYPSLRPLLLKYLPPQLPILQVGMGTSQLQYDMVTQDKYASILSVDYSEVAVRQQQAAHKHIPQLSYQVADARNLANIADGSFAGVLDKGTLDALLCGDNDVEDGWRMIQEVWRVLEPGGVYLQISHVPPNARLRYLPCAAGWAGVEAWEVGQQGACHGPYRVQLGPGSIQDYGLLSSSNPGEGIEAREAFSHWVYAARKRLEVCGLHGVQA